MRFTNTFSTLVTLLEVKGLSGTLHEILLAILAISAATSENIASDLQSRIEIYFTVFRAELNQGTRDSAWSESENEAGND